MPIRINRDYDQANDIHKISNNHNRQTSSSMEGLVGRLLYFRDYYLFQVGISLNQGFDSVLASKYTPATKPFQNRVAFNYGASSAVISSVTLRMNKK